mmetsp:Transcript_12438/g.34257  ORF Transcript_12438/g.34257 Transcript_12438/m.34257 type:complete len:181 (-) Transcript_12438:83-625(-)
MESYSSRANTLFCTFLTVLGTAAFAGHFTTYLPMFEPHIEARIELDEVVDLTVNKVLNMDQCMLKFNLRHNLTEEFNWNMNQLFLYVVATYNDTANVRNEVTIWDNIIVSEDQGFYDKKGLMVEYPLRDQYKELRGRDIRLEVRYRTMPITGVMYEKRVAHGDFTNIPEYSRLSTSTRKR